MAVDPKITHAILLRNYEKCRDQMAEIALSELDYQYTRSYNPFADIGNVYIERSNPIDFIEMSCVNFSIDTIVFSNMSYAGNKTAITSINADVFVKSETTNGQRGDSESRIKCTRVISMLEYIFGDPQYKTLGFDPGFINNVTTENMGMADPEKYDAQNITQGRLVITVTTTENNELLDGVILEQSITQHYINDTNKGLRYEYQS